MGDHPDWLGSGSSCDLSGVLMGSVDEKSECAKGPEKICFGEHFY